MCKYVREMENEKREFFAAIARALTAAPETATMIYSMLTEEGACAAFRRLCRTMHWFEPQLQVNLEDVTVLFHFVDGVDGLIGSKLFFASFSRN